MLANAINSFYTVHKSAQIAKQRQQYVAFLFSMSQEGQEKKRLVPVVSRSKISDRMPCRMKRYINVNC